MTDSCNKHEERYLYDIKPLGMISNISDTGEHGELTWARISYWDRCLYGVSSQKHAKQKWSEKRVVLWRPFGGEEGKEVRLGSVMCPWKSDHRGWRWIPEMSVTGSAGSTGVIQSVPFFYRVHLNWDTAWGRSSRKGTEISQVTHFENQTPVVQKIHL